MKIIMPHSLSVGMGVVGPERLVTVAMAGTTLAPWSDVKSPAISVLTMLPVFTASTFTVTVQLLAAAIEPPVKVTVFPKGVALTEPLQLLVIAGVPAIINSAGKLSVNATFELAVSVLGLDRVKVRVDVSPTVIKTGSKILLIVGAWGPEPGERTIKVSKTELALLPLDVTKAPAGRGLI